MPVLQQEAIDPLDSLEAQIDELERRILGNFDISKEPPHIIESLVQSNTTINDSVSSHGSIKTLFERLDQLGKFLDPSFEDSLVDIVCKRKVVLESEYELREYLNQSKKISELNNTLSGEPFKKVPSLVENLKAVSHGTIKIQNDFEKLKKEIENISCNYTEAIKSLSKTFLIFDTQLTEIEEKSKMKKVLDEPIEEE